MDLENRNELPNSLEEHWMPLHPIMILKIVQG